MSLRILIFISLVSFEKDAGGGEPPPEEITF
jgi:hypothetical protein